MKYKNEIVHAELKMFLLVLFFQGAVSDQNDELHEDVLLGQDTAEQKNQTDLPTFEEFMNDFYDIGEFNYILSPLNYS